MTTVSAQVREGVLWLGLDRPESLNAVTDEMFDELAGHLEAAVADDGVRVVVITGAGRAFSAGADVTTLLGDPDLDRIMTRANRLVRAVPALDKPVVAAVNGAAAGVSCALALACDLVVAGESASFLLPFTRLGLMPDGGSTLTVAASVGRARAMRMALLAEPLTAAEAHAACLITHLVSDAELLTTVETIAARLACGPALALAAAKRAVNAATIGGLESALEREARGQVMLSTTADFTEGVRAFVQKRPPSFTGQ